jgi:hypothetical protein
LRHQLAEAQSTIKRQETECLRAQIAACELAAMAAREWDLRRLEWLKQKTRPPRDREEKVVELKRREQMRKVIAGTLGLTIEHVDKILLRANQRQAKVQQIKALEERIAEWDRMLAEGKERRAGR